MNKNKLIDALKTLRVIMKFCPAKTDEDVTVMVNEYFGELKNYSDYVLAGAVSNIKKFEFEFPTIATMRFYCQKFYAEEIDRLNQNWRTLRDDLKSENKPPKSAFEKLASEYQTLGIGEQVEFVLKYYEENKNYQAHTVSPEKIAEGKKRLKALAESKRMEA